MQWDGVAKAVGNCYGVFRDSCYSFIATEESQLGSL